MALPTTISGISTSVACVGPFISAAGNVYFIGVSSSDTTKLQAQKATDPTSSFSAVGTDPQVRAAGETVRQIAAFQVGDTIHVAAVAYSLSTSSINKYGTFSMASDAWVISTFETTNGPFSPTTSGGAAVSGISLVVRSDGVVILTGHQGHVTSMGNDYSQICAMRRTGVNTWAVAGAANPISAGGTVDFTLPEAVLGTSDRVHFLWKNTNNTVIEQRSLSSGNALQTASTGAGILSEGASAVSYDRSGTIKVACYGQAARVVYFDSADTPTLSLNNSTPTGQPGRLFVDDTTIWALTRSAVDSDLYASSSTDNGATFGTAVDVFTATVSATETNLSIDGNIFTRGSSVVIPYVVNDNGTLKYNEYVVRTIAAAVTPKIFQYNQAVKRSAFW